MTGKQQNLLYCLLLSLETYAIINYPVVGFCSCTLEYVCSKKEKSKLCADGSHLSCSILFVKKIFLLLQTENPPQPCSKKMESAPFPFLKTDNHYLFSCLSFWFSCTTSSLSLSCCLVVLCFSLHKTWLGLQRYLLMVWHSRHVTTMCLSLLHLTLTLAVIPGMRRTWQCLQIVLLMLGSNLNTSFWAVDFIVLA